MPSLLVFYRSLVPVSSTTTVSDVCFALVKVVRQFREAGFMADADDDQGATLNKKIRSAQLAQYNYIFGKSAWVNMD